jgi:CheY-like chemotaxis protein
VLDLRDGRLVVDDLGSHNGTEVNGERLSEPRPLADGDLLWVGGSVFAVRLRPGTTAGSLRRVLVVEDDAEAAEILTALLRLWGHDVQLARDGIRAVEAAREHPPDAVLLDLDVGAGPDGREVAQQLREEDGVRNARMLAVTGRPTTPAEAEGAFDGLLFKPVEPSALRDALATE